MYTPQNTLTFVTAIAGAMSGMNIAGRPISSATPSDYAMASAVANAFSEQFDTEWGTATPDTFEVFCILESCSDYWSGRDAFSDIPTSYAVECAAIIAAITSAHNLITSEGITIPAWGGSGSGTVTDVTGTAPIIITGSATTTPNVTHGVSGVTAGTVGDATHVAQVTVDTKGHITGIAAVAITAGGSGNATEFQTVPIANTTAEQSQVYIVNAEADGFDLRQITQDDIAPGFSITGFSGGSTVEVGDSVINPAFTASYSSTPASANITNTDGTDSPLNLTTPFTTGTVVGTFHHTAEASVGFTLTAVGSVTKTAGQNINFFPRTFGGVGTAGASSATASGNNAVLNSGDGTLASEGLFSGIVGQTFGPFNPSGQNIYVLTPHTGSPHTFKDQNGFAFAMNAPTTFNFTNQFGAVISYDLYQSTNVLSSTFTLTVQS